MFSTYFVLALKVLCRAQGVGSVSSFSDQPDSTMEPAYSMHPSAVLSQLRPRFATSSTMTDMREAEGGRQPLVPYYD